jgi:hypothetical protein
MKNGLTAIAILLPLLGAAKGYAGKKDIILSVERLDCRLVLSGGIYSGITFSITSPEFSAFEHQASADAKHLTTASREVTMEAKALLRAAAGNKISVIRRDQIRLGNAEATQAGWEAALGSINTSETNFLGGNFSGPDSLLIGQGIQEGLTIGPQGNEIGGVLDFVWTSPSLEANIGYSGIANAVWSNLSSTPAFQQEGVEGAVVANLQAYPTALHPQNPFTTTLNTAYSGQITFDLTVVSNVVPGTFSSVEASFYVTVNMTNPNSAFTIQSVPTSSIYPPGTVFAP